MPNTCRRSASSRSAECLPSSYTRIRNKRKQPTRALAWPPAARHIGNGTLGFFTRPRCDLSTPSGIFGALGHDRRAGLDGPRRKVVVQNVPSVAHATGATVPRSLSARVGACDLLQTGSARCPVDRPSRPWPRHSTRKFFGFDRLSFITQRSSATLLRLADDPHSGWRDFLRCCLSSAGRTQHRSVETKLSAFTSGSPTLRNRQAGYGA